MNKNIWFTGVPGSKWSGVDIQLRNMLPCDRTDETPDRVFYHRVNRPGDKNNGHRGSYWGPGMGCGEHWTNLHHLTKERLETDIEGVFHGEGFRVLKSHFFARHHNLDWIWHNFKDDWMILLYRESQSSFSWWANVMDFGEGHYPDYTPGYKDYNTMRPKLFEENEAILDFGLKMGMQFKKWDPKTSVDMIPGFDAAAAAEINKSADDVYVAVARIE